MYRRMSVSTVLASSLLLACDAGAPTQPDPTSVTATGVEAGATEGARKKVRRVKGGYTASGEGGPDRPECFGAVLVNLEGEGEETVLGQYTIVATSCMGGLSFQGTFTKTARRGQVTGTYSGTITPGQPDIIDGTAVITGGTGRFAGATGRQKIHGSQVVLVGEDPVNPTFLRHTLEVKGRIRLQRQR